LRFLKGVDELQAIEANMLAVGKLRGKEAGRRVVIGPLNNRFLTASGAVYHDEAGASHGGLSQPHLVEWHKGHSCDGILDVDYGTV
jgi:hypothetical protein